MMNLKEESAKIKKEVRERMIGYLVAALGLVAGLAWNEAIKGLIEYLFPLHQNSLWVKFFYAIAMTIVVVVMTMYLLRLIAPPDPESKK